MKMTTNRKLLCNLSTILIALIVGLAFMPADVEAASKKPGRVSGVKITSTTSDTVTLSWKKTKGAKGYCIYKKIAGSKKWSKAVTTKNRKVTVRKLRSGNKYSFKIRAYKKKRGKTVWGKYSAVKTAKTKVKPKPATQDGYIAIDEKNFPDPMFRDALRGITYDKNQDGKFSPSEIAAIRVLSLSSNGWTPTPSIKSLKGVEHFFALEELYCSRTGHAYAYNGGMQLYDGFYPGELANLNVSKNSALRILDCSYNKLTSLDVSRNLALEVLICNDNPLGSIDVTQNSALKIFDCRWNKLANLDVRKNKYLKKLYCNGNLLSNLDVSMNGALEILCCTYNKLPSLDVSKNKVLDELTCDEGVHLIGWPK